MGECINVYVCEHVWTNKQFTTPSFNNDVLYDYLEHFYDCFVC